MNILFFAGLAVQISAIIFPAVIKNPKKALVISQGFLIAGLLISIVPTLILLFLNISDFDTRFGGLFHFDGLANYFLFVMQLVAIPTTIYNLSYFRHYIEEKKPVRNFLIFYIIMLVSSQVIVIANHAILFLVSWEIMSISGYAGMMLEKEKEEVQTGSFYYLAASHALIFIMYIAFFLLHHESGSWFFTDFDLSNTDKYIVSAIFLLSFTSFGIKAGFIPFHFWLPQAHPIAPTPLSAFLSGVIIKLGIYGIMRTILFLPSVSEWMGWLVLSVSMISAIFGVWYALAQHDIKKLLAYHSVENIGIIGLGIGIGLIGSANNSNAIMILGYGGALLHTLNHAVFKSLLFTGSGVIYQNLGTRNIESMGGIIHHSRIFSLLFIIGSVAISGIPPLNGFVSEFIIFNGFFTISNELKNNYSLVMLLCVVGLAFVGGLAVACFTKINSIMLLGAERTKIESFKVSKTEYLSLWIFAGICIFIGFYPQPVLAILNNVLADRFVPEFSETLFSIKWIYINLVSLAIIAGVALLYLLRLAVKKRYGIRKSPAWGCGYSDITSRMQYSASSYADELNTIPRALLVYRKHIKQAKTVYPEKTHFESHSEDFVDRNMVMPGFRKFRSAMLKLDYFSKSDVRYYVFFILLTIAFYGMVAYLWS
ncbi:MAG TPA: proton-conducting transporter membrane subunit [bacterium]|nr:proton-conducting transporter membrane subunit [bacterium]HPS29208.1 proton-conducting transporter membrane subunit [bacterium]